MVIGKERKYDEVDGCLLSGGMSRSNLGLSSNTTTSSHQLSAWYGTDRYQPHLQSDSITMTISFAAGRSKQAIICLPLEISLGLGSRQTWLFSCLHFWIFCPFATFLKYDDKCRMLTQMCWGPLKRDKYLLGYFELTTYAAAIHSEHKILLSECMSAAISI